LIFIFWIIFHKHRLNYQELLGITSRSFCVPNLKICSRDPNRWLWPPFRGCSWLAARDYSCLFVAVRGCSWWFVAVRGCSWLFVAVRGFAWFFVVVRGCSWLFWNSMFRWSGPHPSPPVVTVHLSFSGFHSTSIISYFSDISVLCLSHTKLPIQEKQDLPDFSIRLHCFVIFRSSNASPHTVTNVSVDAMTENMEKWKAADTLKKRVNQNLGSNWEGSGMSSRTAWSIRIVTSKFRWIWFYQTSTFVNHRKPLNKKPTVQCRPMPFIAILQFFSIRILRFVLVRIHTF